LKNSTFIHTVRFIRFIIFFYREFSKTRDKASRNIYNSLFRNQLENLWVVFLLGT
jgi:hypothetical protein